MPIFSARQIENFDLRHHSDGCRSCSAGNASKAQPTGAIKLGSSRQEIGEFSDSIMTDKLEDLRTFVTVVQARGFAQAGKRLGIAKSAISRRVNDLEDRLGARLLNRTTRQLSTTPAGAELFERGLRLLADFQETEDAVSSGSNEPTGRLRVSAPVSFGSHCLGQTIPEFMSRFPRLQVELELEDRVIDLVGSGYDVAVRISRLKDSSLIARKIVTIQHVICGSPDYFRRRGRPKVPEDLHNHTTLRYSYVNDCWEFTKDETLSPPSKFRCNSGDTLREAAIAGGGLAYLPTFIVHEAVADGRLEVCLSGFEKDPIALYAVYPTTRHLSAKIRVFIDFLVEKFGTDPFWDKAIGLKRAKS
jgi:DNA-binding transcriptional LysR family regulator